MKGNVDLYGRALIALEVLTDDGSETLDAWIDTGFTGELTLSIEIVRRLKLKEIGTLDAVLADGSLVSTSSYACTVMWCGSPRTIEVLPTSGEFPLIGVSLMLGCELRINYATLEVELRAYPKTTRRTEH